ncbi:hypothetical protein A8B78_11900 [Jannaschia sp. EhC01]|nr:hypothetical protein A8B78_11900 [Jannaschia sp. EhC01]
MPTRFSRRAVLGQIALGGMVMTASGPVRHAFAQADQEPWYFLTNAEARWLSAVVDIFIPEDEFPSATQAGVVDFIDFQMATGYGQGDGLYLEGPFQEGTAEQGYQLPYTPAEMLRAAISTLMDETDITALPAADRDAYVTALSERTEPLGDIPASTFFSEILKLANQGYFADPIYMGNRQYAGWEMVGFPGAHAYYLQRVDLHNLPVDQPPMGIVHGDGGHNTLPRIIEEEA